MYIIYYTHIMVLNFAIETKDNKNTSKLFKSVIITNDGRPISYRTIKKFYKHLLSEGYEGHKMFIKVLNPERYFTLKAYGESEIYDTSDYYIDKVKDLAQDFILED